ncbi:MAG: hypothetical protein WCY23_05735 [Candidatus Omnitrophota bacterium]
MIKIISFLIALGISISMTMPSAAEDNTEGYHLNVDWTQKDGGVFYETLILKNMQLRFSEKENSVHCLSELIDYDIDVGAEGGLSSFRVVLRDRREQKFVGEGKQGFHPLFKQTVYWDMDGDTVFDAMSNAEGSYILLNNYWIKVNNAIDTKTRYAFKHSSWEKLAQTDQQLKPEKSVTKQLVVDLFPAERDFRPQLTLQRALKLAESYIEKEEIDISSYYLHEAKYILYGSKDKQNPCWFFLWANENGALGDYVEIIVSIDTGNIRRLPSM